MARVQWREGEMYNEDMDALAAEYVLGTLSADERGRAEALLLVDTGFGEIVRQWERRLGELNVMVEAVEPPSEVWAKIAPAIGKVAIGEVLSPEEGSIASIESAPPTAPVPKPETENLAAPGGDAQLGAQAETNRGGGDSPLLAALASTLMAEDGSGESRAGARPELMASQDSKLQPPVSSEQMASNNDVSSLARQMRRWRLLAIAAGLCTIMLGAYVAVSRFAPQLLGAAALSALGPAAPAPAASDAPSPQFVAALQQGPVAPAFLVSVDPTRHTLTIRRLAGPAPAGHAYQLWWFSPQNPKPRSLGLIGADDFTPGQLPAELDTATLRVATYEVSFEPASGSPGDAPSGPILFTGKMVEAVPEAAPKPPK